MSKKIKADPFQSISQTDLAVVNGGRLIPNKGPTQAVVQGMQMLVKTIGEVGQVMQANDQAKSQQSAQLMQQMMGRRGG